MSTPTNELDVWVLAGQSNMQGCGPLKGALAADQDVWCHTSAGNWEPAVDPLHRLWESYTPVHQDLMRPSLSPEDALLSNEDIAKRDNETRTHGSCLGIAFGNAWKEATGNPVGLIASAHGGTSLGQWHQDLKSEGTSSLYGAMLDRIEKAGGKLNGILWYQGESDTPPGVYETYAERFDAWVAAVRRDTGIPDLPVIVVQLSRLVVMDTSEEGPRSWNVIREAQRTLPERSAHTDVAPAIDLDLSDAIHVGTPGLIRLGRRMARQALAMQSGGTAGPRLKSATTVRGFADTGFIRLEFDGVEGKWNPEQNIGGFSVHTKDGKAHPSLQVINAFRCASDPTAIVILLTGKVDDDTAIAYGIGYNPHCTAVDDADMALLAFAPIAVAPL